MDRATHKGIIAQDRETIKDKISMFIGIHMAAWDKGTGWGYAAV